MIKETRLKEKNRIGNAKTRMAVYIYIYIVYCHLENKNPKSQNSECDCQKYNYILKFKKLNTKNRDRTILNLYRS